MLESTSKFVGGAVSAESTPVEVRAVKPVVRGISLGNLTSILQPASIGIARLKYNLAVDSSATVVCESTHESVIESKVAHLERDVDPCDFT